MFRKMVTPQRAWKKDEVYESVFAIRMVQAVVVGVMCGLGKMEGLYVFLTFLGLNYVLPNSWFSYQNVRPEEYEDEKSPLSMEGFGQAISLFLLCWVTAYSVL